MNRKRRLTDEERVLWSQVARTTVPLKGKTFPETEQLSRDNFVESGSQGKSPGTRANRPSPPAVRAPNRLDAPTRQKLARGRIALAGRIDLHGLTQEEAHSLLLSVLHRAYNEDRRYVLVITGKGSAGGSGILRRAVPQWLSTPPFRTYVSGYDEAARNHGGAGALYIRLRRRRGQA